MGRISMTHYQIPNSVLYGRAKGSNVTKELKAYSLETTLQKRANNGNADAKKLIKQLKDTSNG